MKHFLLGLFLLTAGLGHPSESMQDDTVCAVVRVQFSQQLVLTRTVFTATLELNNGTTALLEDVEAVFTFDEVGGDAADQRFSVGLPSLVGYFGTGEPLAGEAWGWSLGDVLPNASGQATWTISPLREAAPTETSVRYEVGGVLRYRKNGSLIVAPLFPQTIEVRPNPSLTLNYYLQRIVYSDDPFTPDVVEPAEPFSLGLMVQNAGPGVARDVRIQSFEEVEIIDNQNGLAVAFQVLGGEVDGVPQPGETRQALGDIDPGENRVVRWLMTTNIQGEFRNLVASFSHRDGLGGTGDQGLIEAVVPYWLVHAVRLGKPMAHLPSVPSPGGSSSGGNGNGSVGNGRGHVRRSPWGSPPADDGKPDFLVEGLADTGRLPAGGLGVTGALEVHSSAGEVEGVERIDVPDVRQDGPPSSSDLSTSVSLPMSRGGWKYLVLTDLGGASFVPQRITRVGLEGRFSTLVGGTGDVSNAWRTVRAPSAGAPQEYRLHFLEFFSVGGDYRLEIEYSAAALMAMQSSVTHVSVATGGTVEFTLSDPEATGAEELVYQIIGSLGDPGTEAAPHLRGAADPYGLSILRGQGVQTTGFRGIWQGGANASLRLPPGLGEHLIGKELRHEFLLLHPKSGLHFRSNVVTTLLVP